MLLGNDKDYHYQKRAKCLDGADHEVAPYIW